MSDDEDYANPRWDNLKTINEFDGFENVVAENFQRPLAQRLGSGIHKTMRTTITPPSPTHSIVVESLVHHMCMLIEPEDKAKAEALYERICESLRQINIISVPHSNKEFDQARLVYRQALHKLLSVSYTGGKPISRWPLANTHELEWSRYYREFEEFEHIARGGFGSVYKARNKLDRVVYAIKKVKLKSSRVDNISTHLREVATLASLTHPNIVSYKAAWLEPTLGKEVMVKGKENSTRGETETDETTTMDEEQEEEEEEEDYDDDAVNFVQSIRTSSTNESSSVIFDRGSQSECLIEKSKEESYHEIVKFVPPLNIPESPSYVNLKFATLYIQMTLCHLTLREFLQARSAEDNFAEFYLNFIMQNRRRHHTDSSRNFKPHDYENSCSDNSAFVCEPLTHMEFVLDIFIQLLRGLNYIHNNGIIHHDIKPSNIFVNVTEHGQIVVQLGDFGLACPLQGTAVHGIGVGTPQYAAPEQLAGLCDLKSDIYSLGLILLELLVPCTTDMERAKMLDNARKGKVPETLSVNFNSLVKQLLCKDPRERPDTERLLDIFKKLCTIKDPAIIALERRLSEQDTEIQSLKQLVEEQKKVRDDQVRDKEEEIRKLKAKLQQMELQCDKDEEN